MAGIMVWYLWPSDTVPTQLPQVTKTALPHTSSLPASNLNSETPVKEDSGKKWPDCVDKMTQYVNKVCNLACFNAHLKSKHLQLFSLVADHWFDQQKTPTAQSELGLFFSALSHAGLIDGRLPQNNALAHKEMTQVLRRDSQNGFYMLFMAYMDYLNENHAGAQTWLAKAAASSYYQNTIVTWVRRLYEATAGDERYYLHAIGYASGIPFPNFFDLNVMLEEYPAESIVIARKMMAPGLRSNGAMEMVYYAGLEYHAGHRLLQKIAPSEGEEHTVFMELPGWVKDRDSIGDQYWSDGNCDVHNGLAEGKRLLARLLKFENLQIAR